MSKENFKSFVRKNPSLIRYVKDNEMTWQKFYEIYDLYGENQNVWKKYLEISSTNNSTSTNKTASSLLGDTSLKDVFNAVKKIDLDSVKKGVDGLQKIVGLAQDIVSAKTGAVQGTSTSYQRRPMYKYFED